MVSLHGRIIAFVKNNNNDNNSISNNNNTKLSFKLFYK